MEFWRNEKMDKIIEDIIDIFTNVEGVELVRLSGLTKRAINISGFNDLKPYQLDNIIKKLNRNNIINFKYIMICPHCDEVSYQIIERDNTNQKLCDTCKTMYKLNKGSTIFFNNNENKG
ncbi:MAG: hypothetical protein ACOC2W_03580 [bacterium]